MSDERLKHHADQMARAAERLLHGTDGYMDVHPLTVALNAYWVDYPRRYTTTEPDSSADPADTYRGRVLRQPTPVLSVKDAREALDREYGASNPVGYSSSISSSISSNIENLIRAVLAETRSDAR